MICDCPRGISGLVIHTRECNVRGMTALANAVQPVAFKHQEPKTVQCAHCGLPTSSTGSSRCDRCWELETRMRRDVVLAYRILRHIDSQKP